jgi:protein phosphatase
MDCFGLTDSGLKRPTNQDHYLIADLNKSMRIHDTSLTLDSETRVYGGSQGKLLIVADGMGGEADDRKVAPIEFNYKEPRSSIGRQVLVGA